MLGFYGAELIGAGGFGFYENESLFLARGREVRLVRRVRPALAGRDVGPGAPGQTADELRGERVGWARLKTPSEYWRRHATGDPVLMRFMRENTSLNIDPTWYVADIEKLDEMCAYPLVFSQGTA